MVQRGPRMKAIVKYAEKPGILGLRDMPKPEPGHVLLP